MADDANKDGKDGKDGQADRPKSQAEQGRPSKEQARQHPEAILDASEGMSRAGFVRGDEDVAPFRRGLSHDRTIERTEDGQHVLGAQQMPADPQRAGLDTTHLPGRDHRHPEDPVHEGDPERHPKAAGPVRDLPVVEPNPAPGKSPDAGNV